MISFSMAGEKKYIFAEQAELLKLVSDIHSLYPTTYKALSESISTYLNDETRAISSHNHEILTGIYEAFPTIWNTAHSSVPDHVLKHKTVLKDSDFCLFSSYYAGNYYGISQAVSIDAIVKLIKTRFSEYSNLLFSCLFYAMNEAAFIKNGHMPRPLALSAHDTLLIRKRSLDIYALFMNRLKSYINAPETFTDDVYSIFNPAVYRRYHLLITAMLYDYPEPKLCHGKYTAGLYPHRSSMNPPSEALASRLVLYSNTHDGSYLTEILEYFETRLKPLGKYYKDKPYNTSKACPLHTVIDDILELISEFDAPYQNLLKHAFAQAMNTARAYDCDPDPVALLSSSILPFKYCHSSL